MDVQKTFFRAAWYVCWLLMLWAGTGCNAGKYLKEDAYLLRKNTLNLKTDKGITRKGALKENLQRQIIQKPNTRTLGIFPYKVWLYNIRHDKYEADSSNFQLQSGTVEQPVVFDSLQMHQSSLHFRNYLFNQGYFYPEISDTVVYRDRKAYVTYHVHTGINFLIKDIHLDVDDSLIHTLVAEHMEATVLKEGTPFSMSLLESERSRITTLLKDHGYYRFSQDNIVDFSLDTFSNNYLKDSYSTFESAINFLTFQKAPREKPTLNITVFIRGQQNPNAYRKYKINRINVYPDFEGRDDWRDSSMIEKNVQDVRFRYHNYYVREQVLRKHLYFEQGNFYSQADYENTINKLNQLGIFQSIRIFLSEDTTLQENNTGFLNVNILLTPSDKMDYGINFEISNGTTYILGSALTLNFRNRNFAKGANLLTTAVSGGIETTYDDQIGDNFFSHFRLLTKNFGLNASINFPKFLVPFRVSHKIRNLPRTIIGVGTTMLDRVNYFTLTNTSANLTYNWRETQNKTWDITPAFVNMIRLPNVSDSFSRRLADNDFLRNSYRETFIQGENIVFTYTNQTKSEQKNYTYIRLGVEEGGGLMTGVAEITPLRFRFAQYLRFDFDLRRYLNTEKSQLALRLYGGVGIPYGSSSTLPYIKQYFVGGAYSIRGWRIRTLGPGSYYDPALDTMSVSYIDRTGDIKLEMNAEYRFDMLQLFSGSIRLKGAIFADAGNIWLAQPSKDYPGGDFSLSRLGSDLAVSTGAGIRFDLAGFFVFRLDAAFPVKKPYLPNGGWVLDELRPLTRSWREENLVLNFAIGYPF